MIYNKKQNNLVLELIFSRSDVTVPRSILKKSSQLFYTNSKKGLIRYLHCLSKNSWTDYKKLDHQYLLLKRLVYSYDRFFLFPNNKKYLNLLLLYSSFIVDKEVDLKTNKFTYLLETSNRIIQNKKMLIGDPCYLNLLNPKFERGRKKSIYKVYLGLLYTKNTNNLLSQRTYNLKDNLHNVLSSCILFLSHYISLRTIQISRRRKKYRGVVLTGENIIKNTIVHFWNLRQIRKNKKWNDLILYLLKRILLSKDRVFDKRKGLIRQINSYTPKTYRNVVNRELDSLKSKLRKLKKRRRYV